MLKNKFSMHFIGLPACNPSDCLIKLLHYCPFTQTPKYKQELSAASQVGVKPLLLW